MTLLLDALYRPFKDFFIEKFGRVGGSAAHFRFAAEPRAFVDSDFVVPQHPEWGPSPQLARERMSRVVDGVPTLEIDGLRVSIGSASISELYADELVAPAVPATNVQTQVDAFDRIKAEARKLYETSRIASIVDSGELLPADATPERWWDTRDGSAWTHQSFEVVGAATAPAAPTKPSAIETFLGIFRARGKGATQPSVTSVVISFDFCLVRVARPWLYRAFLEDRSWMVPGRLRGALSANDGHGLPALPVGFVAIKDLRIVAPWTADDISALEESVQFGPFDFDSRVVDGAIGHAGIQIVGWLLEDVLDLPPASDPGAARVPAARTSGEVLGYLDVHRAEIVRGPVDRHEFVEHAFLDGPVPATWWAPAEDGSAPLGPRTGMAGDVETLVIARARRWLDEGDATAAEAVARALAVMTAPDAAVPVLLGDALARQDRTTDARAAYDLALQRAPKDLAALAARGELLLASDVDAGLTDLESAFALDPDRIDPRANRARALHAATLEMLRKVLEEKRAKERAAGTPPSPALSPPPTSPPPTPPPAIATPASSPPGATVFDGEALARVTAGSARPVLVEFAAPWAGPSRALAPIIDALAAAYAGRVDVIRLDVDGNPDAVAQYGVQKVPTVLLFRSGIVVDRIVGAVPRARVEAMIERALAPATAAPGPLAAILLSGRWSSALGAIVFVPQGLGFRYEEYNLFGAVVGGGTATIRNMLVELEGVSADAGAYHAELRWLGDQLTGWVESARARMALTLSRG